MSKWSLSAVADTMPLSTTPLSTTPPTMGSIMPPTMGSVTMEPTLDTPHTIEYSLPHTSLTRGRPRLRPAQRLKLMLQDQNVMLKDMVMEVMADTAKRLLKKLPTMYLYLPQLISLSRFPTLFPKRFVLTNPFLFPWPHAKLNWEPPPAQTMSSACPNNAVLHLFTDMLNMSHQDIITKLFKS